MSENYAVNMAYNVNVPIQRPIRVRCRSPIATTGRLALGLALFQGLLANCCSPLMTDIIELLCNALRLSKGLGNGCEQPRLLWRFQHANARHDALEQVIKAAGQDTRINVFSSVGTDGDLLSTKTANNPFFCINKDLTLLCLAPELSFFLHPSSCSFHHPLSSILHPPSFIIIRTLLLYAFEGRPQ